VTLGIDIKKGNIIYVFMWDTSAEVIFSNTILALLCTTANTSFSLTIVVVAAVSCQIK